MLSTQAKGVASEKLVEVDLILQGFDTFQPASQELPYDLIAQKDGKFYKIQVKMGQKKQENRIYVDARKGSAKERHYDHSDYDVLAVVDLEHKKVAYIPKNKINVTAILWTTDEINTNGFHKKHIPLKFHEMYQFPA